MLLAVIRLRAGLRLRAPGRPGRPAGPGAEGRLGWLLALAGGAGAVAAATVLVLVLRAPAIPVAAAGAAAVAVRIGQRKLAPGQVRDTLGIPVLTGLFGIAVAFGTLGRTWNGPAELLACLGGWATAAVAALTSVLINNLPAASLLAARTPPRPFALLVGLNLGPNLFVTGSLA